MNERIIKASEGMWFTPVNANESDPVLGKEIFLGVNDCIDNWMEVTDEYKAEAEQRAKEINMQRINDIMAD